MQVGDLSFLFFLLSIFHFPKGKRRIFFRETVTFFRGNSTLWPKKCAPNSSSAVSWLHQFPPLSKGQKTHCVEEEGPKEEGERYLLAGFFSLSVVCPRKGWSSCADFFFFFLLPPQLVRTCAVCLGAFRFWPLVPLQLNRLRVQFAPTTTTLTFPYFLEEKSIFLLPFLPSLFV